VYASGAAAGLALLMMGAGLKYLANIAEAMGGLREQVVGIQRQIDQLDGRVQQHEQALQRLRVGKGDSW
jgi:flagellar biosynthesis chaperone FliJ